MTSKPVKIEVSVRPFGVPNYVLYEGIKTPSSTETPKSHLSEVSEEVLSQLCDQFRENVFLNAGKKDPRVK